MSESVPDSPPAPPIVAAVIVNDGRVLLVQRRVREGSLSWQFPAGAMENGESPGEAAVRETQEETGLTVVSRKILGKRIHPATGRVMIYVSCDVVAGHARVLDDEELMDIAWSKGGQLAEYVPHGFYQPVQQHLEEVLDSYN